MASPGRVPVSVALGGAVALAGLQYALSPPGRDPVQDMAMLVAQHRTNDEPVGTYRVFVRNLAFYTHVPSEDLASRAAVRAFLDRPERVLCVLRRRDLGEARAHVLGEVPYLNVSAVRLRTLFSPDPARDLERVVLVSNR